MSKKQLGSILGISILVVIVFVLIFIIGLNNSDVEQNKPVEDTGALVDDIDDVATNGDLDDKNALSQPNQSSFNESSSGNAYYETTVLDEDTDTKDSVSSSKINEEDDDIDYIALYNETHQDNPIIVGDSSTYPSTDTSVAGNTSTGKLEIEYLPYIMDLSTDSVYVDAGGSEYYHIIAPEDTKLITIKQTETGKTLFSRHGAQDILLHCNSSDIVSNVEIIVQRKDNTKYTYSPSISLQTGKITENENIEDITAY